MFLGFFGIQYNMKVSGSARVSRPRGSVNKIQPNKVNMLHHLILSGNFLGSEIRHGIFWD